MGAPLAQRQQPAKQGLGQCAGNAQAARTGKRSHSFPASRDIQRFAPSIASARTGAAAHAGSEDWPWPKLLTTGCTLAVCSVLACRRMASGLQRLSHAVRCRTWSSALAAWRCGRPATTGTCHRRRLIPLSTFSCQRHREQQHPHLVHLEPSALAGRRMNAQDGHDHSLLSRRLSSRPSRCSQCGAAATGVTGVAAPVTSRRPSQSSHSP